MRELAAEVLQHLRGLAGQEAVVQAYTEARAAVLASRADRKRSQAVQVGMR